MTVLMVDFKVELRCGDITNKLTMNRDITMNLRDKKNLETQEEHK